MSSGLETTFAILAATHNDAAVNVLVPALDSLDREIRNTALRTLLERRSLVGQHEILRRLGNCDDTWRQIINEQRGRMSQALRDAIVGTDQTLCGNACQAIIWFHEYDLAPTLVNALEDDSNPSASLAATTLLSLCEQLYVELAGPRDYRQRRDPQMVRRNVTASLQQSATRYSMHRRIEVLEAFCLLAGRDNVVLQQLLHDPLHTSYLALIDVLTHSQRPGIMRLVLSYLDDPQAPSAALNVIAHRSDRKFVELVLRKVGGEPSAAAKINLKRIDNVTWLKHLPGLLAELDETSQHSAVQLVLASAMRRPASLGIIEYLLGKGKPAGRRAAVAGLADFHGSDANLLVLRALDDGDPQVQALAIGQLRQRGMPGALTTLIEALDSPHPIVRRTARESLGEFSFRKFLSSFDMLDEAVRQSTGRLVRRVDPESLNLLREEMIASSRRRRIRAVQMAVVMELCPQIEEQLGQLLSDDDHLVRLEAARAMAHTSSLRARAALNEARSDSSVLVQEAALHSLQLIENRRAPAVPRTPRGTR